MTRVFLADPHAVVREGLRRIIERQGDMIVAGEAADGRAVLLAAGRETWDILILDLRLPKVDGFEVLRRVHEAQPALRVIVFSAYPEQQYGFRVLNEGAAAYLSRDMDAAELTRAIRVVAVGGTYLSRGLTRRMQLGAPAPEGPHATLSARQNQIFTLVFQGRTVSDIAAQLDLAVSTVSNHVGRIKDKLGARSIGEIVSYAHRTGLAGP